MMYTEKKKLYKNLAKDALSVSKREKLYSEMALSEMAFSKHDLAIAKRKNQISRAEDDREEIMICKEFGKYRSGISNIYKNLSQKYMRKAK